MAGKRRRIVLHEESAQLGLEKKQDFEMGHAAQRGQVQQGTPPELARQQDVPVQAKTTEREVELVLEMPSAVVVHVAGTFNNWDTQHDPLRKGKDGLWRTRVRVPAGRHQYRFIVDGEWMSDPKASAAQPNAYGSTNSVLEA